MSFLTVKFLLIIVKLILLNSFQKFFPINIQFLFIVVILAILFPLLIN
jgi:hypothetical protein